MHRRKNVGNGTHYKKTTAILNRCCFKLTEHPIMAGSVQTAKLGAMSADMICTNSKTCCNERGGFLASSFSKKDVMVVNTIHNPSMSGQLELHANSNDSQFSQAEMVCWEGMDSSKFKFATFKTTMQGTTLTNGNTRNVEKLYNDLSIALHQVSSKQNIDMMHPPFLAHPNVPCSI